MVLARDKRCYDVGQKPGGTMPFWFSEPDGVGYIDGESIWEIEWREKGSEYDSG